ncbi:uncharacterized protein [Aristolochia californica]|uniref:uncharacterized protein n=1 Tax=Aristolochia californica TaxID=171875 RepID=UPI0035D911BB
MDRENTGASLIRSPTPTANRSNHNLITPDSSVRGKSFTGTAAGRPSISAIQRNFYPVTPANSPASQEIPPRKMRASFDKENEKDRTASSSVRTQSPVNSKGTKNFMAPTISAASKVAASPKKKVLSEINEMVRSSVSLSDVKSSVMSMNSLESSSGTGKAFRKSEISSVSLSIPANFQITKQLTSGDQIQRAPVSLPDGNFPFVSEELSDISETGREKPKLENKVGSETQSDDPKSSLYGESPESVTPDNSKVTETLEPKFSESVYSDDRLNPKEDNFSSQASPHISSRPPYDPKTNYLSPRPRFLHYRPKSRIEICLSRENDSYCDKGIKLEKSFTSESSSDTEEAVEIPNDSEESFFHDEEAEYYEETCVTRPITESSNGCIKRRFGSYLSGERKVKSALLVFVIACLSMSITDSPGIVISSFLPKTYFSNQLFAPAYENLERTAQSFKQWSVSYWSKANIFSKKEKTGKFQFSNLTSLDREICKLLDIMAAENPANFFPGVQFKETDKKSRTGLEREEQIVEDFTEAKLHVTREDSKDHRGSNLVEEDKIEQKLKGEEGHSVYSVAEAMQNQIGSRLESEEKNKEDAADHVDDESKEVAEEVVEIVLQVEAQDEEDLSHHESTNNIDMEVVEEIVDAALEAEQLSSKIGNESQETITSDYHTYIKSESTSEEAASGKSDCFSTFHAGNTLWVHIALTSFAFLALVAVSSTIYLKHKKVSAVHPTVLKQNCPAEKVVSKGDSYLKGSRKSHMEVDILGGSGPSEMSSSVRKSSSHSGRRKIEEIRSIERKVRRNSLVSDCSAESPSFGSFTTYEMLQGKHGCQENDELTPVRRSGRIRKRITSP